MSQIIPDQHRANVLHVEGEALDADGREDEAIAKYHEALNYHSQKAETYYNLGLIYKYRGNWEQSFDFNLKANALVPENEAARWNLAIAATALRRWDVARKAWRENGIELEGESGPINMNFGQTPVRLNPNDNGEVVWALRIDPVRARILNIPFRGSGFCHDDVVLHDGAAVGHRTREGREYPVFNVLELFKRSAFETCVVTATVSNPSDVDILDEIVMTTNSVMEDWTGNVRALCRQCSEGVPHEHHDHDLPEVWIDQRQIAIARNPGHSLEKIIEEWRIRTGARIDLVER